MSFDNTNYLQIVIFNKICYYIFIYVVTFPLGIAGDSHQVAGCTESAAGWTSWQFEWLTSGTVLVMGLYIRVYSLLNTNI